MQDHDMCPLCKECASHFYHRDRRRTYLHCPVCDLVFVPDSFHLSQQESKREYDLHQNSPDDAGYRKFLSRLLQPVLARIAAGACGLDFGCGPGPTLSILFEERGHVMAIYDPIYAPDQRVFAEQYDFITSSEVFEHLQDPWMEIERLWACLKPEGVLAVMTKRVLTKELFANWHYKNDPTHICFFSESTVQWLGKKLQASVQLVGGDVFLLIKGSEKLKKVNHRGK
ncbi:class I SAM-dependent methyltransferase [Desulfotalea psychrophila]|uniref:Related to methyltransferase n=1 Tax=Desulfotalea psychrophila (strain LSv54 / DSM 12343) TaxID=177439 RepID=Q6ASD3_DESPS|nr:class I SAM-dependent methyltransferase [Desulfotalea psychrophila]CAG34730.1 related to methyltransferase [Desulfotalea psychrophila LSv54]